MLSTILQKIKSNINKIFAVLSALKHYEMTWMSKWNDNEKHFRQSTPYRDDLLKHHWFECKVLLQISSNNYAKGAKNEI